MKNKRANPEDTEAMEAGFSSLIGLLLLRQSSLVGLPIDHPHREVIEMARDSASREIEFRLASSHRLTLSMTALASDWEERFLRCNDQRDALLENSKALAGFVPTNGNDAAKSALATHTKLMEQFK